jgi:hypothetical protein
MLLPNDIETLLLTHFQIVPNARFQGAYCIKHPCGSLEPVRGSYQTVQKILLSMDSRDLTRCLNNLSDLQSSLVAMQQQSYEFSPVWLQASKEQFRLYEVVFDLETVRDYLLDNNK